MVYIDSANMATITTPTITTRTTTINNGTGMIGLCPLCYLEIMSIIFNFTSPVIYYFQFY
jgi:hypothetical protein